MSSRNLDQNAIKLVSTCSRLENSQAHKSSKSRDLCNETKEGSDRQDFIIDQTYNI